MSNKQLYIGFTNNLPKRLSEHKQGKVFTTKKYLPVSLIYYEAYLAREDAKERETMLKAHASTWVHLKRRIKHSIKTTLLKISREGSRVVIILLLFFLFLPIKSVLAENLLIIEVQIAGEKTDNDFIKIYNPLNYDLDISGYKLRKRTSAGSESSIRVFPGGNKIPAKGYFVWANSKDNFHLTIGANVWSTATLSRDNSVALLSPENVILDALAWGESQNPFVEGIPFPENPVANQQLKRKLLNGTYQDTNNNSQDFYLYPASPPTQPKTETLPKEEPQLELEPKSLEESKLITYPSGIFINEILPAPQGPDAENEWIELYNQNTFEVDLSDWKIEDAVGQTTTYILPKGTKIGPQGFLVLYRPVTKITLNNDGDGLNLFQPDGKIIDRVSYEKAPKGESYNKILAGWVWSTILTPGSKNIVSTQETKETGEETEDASAEVGSPQIIDINAASLKELQKLAGIGPVLAQRIIEARPFYSVDEFTKVSGIGPKTLEDIKKQGLAWVDSKLAPPKTELQEKGLAAASQPFKSFDSAQAGQTPKSLVIFLAALALAIFSAAIILILKRKIKTLS